MLKWVVVLVVALIILSAIAPLLSRYGLGRLPGDITVRYKGRLYYLPLTSSVLLSLALTLITRLF